MTSRQSIFLSFFALNSHVFQFRVFRRRYNHGESSGDFPGLRRYNLPTGESNELGEAEYSSYWLAFDEEVGLEPFLCDSSTNNDLTCTYIYRLLKKTCESKLSNYQYQLPDKERERQRRIDFVLEAYELGNQIVWLEPYFLKSKKLFGVLLDFGFRSHGAIHSKETQRLSLSLDERGDRNTSFYADRYKQIRKFIDVFSEDVFRIGDGLEIVPHRCIFDDELLRSKQYEFANHRIGRSQFLGVKNYGPVGQIGKRAKIHFLFCERDRTLSNRLYYALLGKTYPSQFPGMSEMFGCQFGIESVTGTPLEEFSIEHVGAALEKIESSLVNGLILPVFISPFDESDNDDLYYLIKHRCLQLNSPCQFVSTRLLSSKYQLKWATSNIALQIFAKMGGEPWLVTPRSRSCLVIGIGQAHSREYGPAKKYFAYSVLTESSGLYKELRILGDDRDFGSYILNFERQLSAILEQYYDSYERFVIHSTFKVRNREIKAVEDVVAQMALKAGGDKEFVVMKFNEHNKFFAYSSEGNSMTPFESSILRLSKDEFLVWFEGLQLHNPNLKNQIRRPVHVQFLHSNRRLDSSRLRDYIQDSVNISGASWRGFNAKSLPISIKYAYLIAKFYREFQRLGLEEVDFTAVSPWFL